MRKSLLIWGGLIVLFLVLVSDFGSKDQSRTVAYSQFLDRVYNGEVRSADIDMQDMTIRFTDNSGGQFMTNNPELNTSALVGDLRKNNVSFSAKPVKQESFLSRLLMNLLPILLLVGLFVFVTRQMQGG